MLRHGGIEQCHQMSHGVVWEGSKISQKSVTYYLNGPINRLKKNPSLCNINKKKQLQQNRLVRHSLRPPFMQISLNFLL